MSKILWARKKSKVWSSSLIFKKFTELHYQIRHAKMDNYLEIKSRTSQDQKVLNSLILLFYYLIFTSLIYICYYNVSAHQHRKIGKCRKGKMRA